MWKISKEKYKNSTTVQATYAKLADWINKTGQFFIEDDGDSYVIKENPDYIPVEGQDFKAQMLLAQFEETTTENITPTTYMNVMIKL